VHVVLVDNSSLNHCCLCVIYLGFTKFLYLPSKEELGTQTTMLPEFGTPLFYALCIGSVVGPYLLTLSMYAYHFLLRDKSQPLRKANDIPEEAHSHDWKTSIVRPEGISAVVVYYMFMGLVTTFGLDINVIPAAVHDLSPIPKPHIVLAYFVVFDSLMWAIHWNQHNFEWLYRNTHCVHHTVHIINLFSLFALYHNVCFVFISLLPYHFFDFFCFMSRFILRPFWWL